MNLQSLMLLIFALGLLVAAFWMAGKRTKSAALTILRHLEEQGALSPESAVPLDFGKTSFLNAGLRDYRPKVLKSLLQAQVVLPNQEGHFYLAKPEALAKLRG